MSQTPSAAVAARRQRDLALALEIAGLADAVLLRHFRAGQVQPEWKADASPVTAADREAERVIRDRLAQARPGDAVLGEEYGGDQGGSPARRWIVDPLDGTRDFVEGTPHFGTLLALEEEGVLVVGVASAPVLGQRWWGVRGAGAFADGRRLRVSTVAELSAARLAYGREMYWEQRQMMAQFHALRGACREAAQYRGFLGYVRVAEGLSDVTAETTPAIWDVAAPMVIVEEAGGRVTDFTGAHRPDGGTAIATNGLIHQAALALLQRT